MLSENTGWIRNPRSGKTYPGSRGQKKHRIPDPESNGTESTLSVNPDLDLEYIVFLKSSMFSLQGRRLSIKLNSTGSVLQ